MPARPLAPLRLLVGTLTFVAFLANTAWAASAVFLCVLARLLVPLPGFVRLARRGALGALQGWARVNRAGLRLTQPTRVEVRGTSVLDPRASYLVVSNHQSWVDVPVVQGALLDRLPPLRFFFKRELLWVPVIGAACWGLDFPPVRRLGRRARELSPARRRQDMEATFRCCARAAGFDVALLAFAEGTRFTLKKRDAQASPYRHLLVPKAGGAAYTLSALGPRLRSIVDVTVCYPAGRPTFWALISRGIPRIVVEVREVPIPPAWRNGPDPEEPVFREEVQALLRRLWDEKEARLAELLEPAAAARESRPAPAENDAPRRSA